MLRFLPRNDRPFDETALLPYRGTLARLLYARGCSTPAEADRFLHPGLNDLHDPMLLNDMDKALSILAQAKAEGWATVVYGDYDCDGVCATALMIQALRRYGVDAKHYVPLRAEGYGLNVPAVERLAGEYRLLVTVDLGVTNRVEVERARALGMRVIVTDHHQPGLVECPADAVINPLLGNYPFGRLCGTGVVFKLAQALLGFDETLLDLVALATIADIVPLLDENRALVTLGLPHLGERIGVKALMDIARLEAPLLSEAVAFQLSPRINAAGRMEDANDGVRLLLTDDSIEAERLARKLDDANVQRKKIELDIFRQADEQAHAHDFIAEHALIVKGIDWHTGVIGLAAGRLNRAYHAPVCVLSEQDGLLHGSLRSVPGVNIHRCLQQCDDLLLRYGGHEQAAGVTLEAGRYEAFCERLQGAVDRLAAPDAFLPAQVYDLPLAIPEANGALVDDLRLLEPFGCGNPAPIFLSEGVRLDRKRVCGASGAHLQLTLRDGGSVLNGIGFGMGAEASRLSDTVNAAYSLGWNEYMGRKSVQCFVQTIASASSSAELLARVSFEDALLRSLCELHAAEKAGFSAFDGEMITLPDWSSLLSGRQGTLVIARTPETANDLLARFPEQLTLCDRDATDPYCYHALLIEPSVVKGCWRTIVLADGALSPAEPAYWHALIPNARVLALPVSDALTALAGRVDAGDEAYRSLYRQLRRLLPRSLHEAADTAALTDAQTLAGLCAFDALGLAAFREAPFSVTLREPKHCSLTDSPVLGALRALNARKEASGC